MVFADGRCGVYHNDPNVKIKTVQHSPDWSLLYLLAEADPLFNSDWLHRGEPRSLSPEYLDMKVFHLDSLLLDLPLQMPKQQR